MDKDKSAVDNPEGPKLEHSYDDEDDTLTMVDVLKEETKLEDDANAVLGASDAQNCTYPNGYLRRQALYSCLTCIRNQGHEPEKNVENCAGICLACSYSCHEGHELVELYTKRNFRCDCGNGKFDESFKCRLEKKDRNVLNSANLYNHNFYGHYCSCDRPYPDPADEVKDEMIQCVVCEDWFHFRHLNADEKFKDENSFAEMICHLCSVIHPFFSTYYAIKNENSNDSLTDSGDCKLLAIAGGQQNESVEEKALFWPDNWRSMLCQCEKCQQMYKDKHLEFLTDLEDTMAAYESKGKKSTDKSQYEQGLNALLSMNGIQSRDMMCEYNDMMSNLRDYLKKFADNKKVVREDDIKEFFSGMEQKKKRRLVNL